ncbi:MAG: YhjD/YihY/BrkB family envelope integrity protein [Thiohalophilus sp.]|uniref:YhjD/YihY/BrkB family envelope integrity protein n=1 Tax=Thiohalophilus sp. TaxID=3028392 RepID=UPI0028708293|nr:YhjD/YihY/BrkB family envelope integrity protein [Thiohalophilus sp.]MDR9435423.1 YhjD/YihY/BrkB family envelope integrity protein [Thiohalophilus sp.]
MKSLNQIRHHLINILWEHDLRQLSSWRARGIGILRVIYLISRDLATGELNLRAMSLVYTTLLAMVPLLAVSFSVLKGFGVHNQLEPILLNLLTPLGERGAEVTRQIIDFVENVKAGVLGSVGLILLLYTVISLTQKVERAFNYTWQVSENRSMARRFSDYFSVILIGPLLIFAAISVTASISSSTLYTQLENTAMVGWLLQSFNQTLPYILVILAFAFIYVLVPNTRVRVRSALVGATVAGILWQTVGWGFAELVASSPRTIAIYSAFATLFLFIIWLYISWLILLIGASIAFYHQYPERRWRESRHLRLSNRLKEKLTLAAMVAIGRRYYQQQVEWTLPELAHHLNLVEQSLHPILDKLVEAQLLVRTEHEPPRYLPGRAPEKLDLSSIIECIRQADEDEIANPGRLPADPVVDEVFDNYQQAASDQLKNITLRDLVADDQVDSDK